MHRAQSTVKKSSYALYIIYLKTNGFNYQNTKLLYVDIISYAKFPQIDSRNPKQSIQASPELLYLITGIETEMTSEYLYCKVTRNSL